MERDDYFLKPCDMECDRLEILHRVYFDQAATYLKRAGLVGKSETNLSVLDVGCAIGAMTEWISSMTQGSVMGLDIDDRQLAYAQNRLKDKNHSNVEFQTFDLSGDSPLNMQADITYSRLLLHHLPNPSKGIENLIKMTKPGGQIIVGEPVFDGEWINPHDEDYLNVIKWLTKLDATNDWKNNYGKQLIADVSQFDTVEVVETCQYRPIFTQKEDKVFNSYILQLFGDVLVKENVISAQKKEQVVKKMDRIASDPKYVAGFCGVVFVRAKKKSV